MMRAGHGSRRADFRSRVFGSELAMRVRSPAQRVALAVERAAVRYSNADRRERTHITDAYRHPMRRCRMIAELSVFVLAPAPGGSAAGNGAAVRQTRSNRREPNIAGDG